MSGATSNHAARGLLIQKTVVSFVFSLRLFTIGNRLSVPIGVSGINESRQKKRDIHQPAGFHLMLGGGGTGGSSPPRLYMKIIHALIS